MPGVTDMGMVWMGASQPANDMSMGLVANDNNDMLLDHENIYYTPSHHSMSNQSMDDIHTVHSSHMVSENRFKFRNIFLYNKKVWISSPILNINYLKLGTSIYVLLLIV